MRENKGPAAPASSHFVPISLQRVSGGQGSGVAVWCCRKGTVIKAEINHWTGTSRGLIKQIRL